MERTVRRLSRLLRARVTVLIPDRGRGDVAPYQQRRAGTALGLDLEPGWKTTMKYTHLVRDDLLSLVDGDGKAREVG